jgi:hypothetical protein
VCAAEGTDVRLGGVGEGKEMKYWRVQELDPWVVLGRGERRS